MKIEHIAIWVKDLEHMKNFYQTYFNANAGNLYHNPKKQFQSYFLSFESGCRIELMHNPDITESEIKQRIGLTHFAISVGSRQEVDNVTNRLSKDGYEVIGQPRATGDGYYESVILDPEKNSIEITV